MAEADSRGPRIRMPRISMPALGRGSKPGGPAKAGGGKEPTGASTEAPTTEPAKAGEAGEGPATQPGAKPPDPNLQERMEGLQGWMAEIERKQGRLTYFGAAAILIAILAAGAALYFGTTAKSDNDGTQDDVEALQQSVDGLEQAVTKNSKETQDTINSTIGQLQATISDLQQKQAQDAANISTLQSQAASGAFSKGAAAPTATPGTTTTTPKKP